MAASVRVEDEAFCDRRYDRLAKAAGLADADHARGKMLLLWRQCTIEGSHILPPEDVEGVLGPNGVRALVSSRLGEPTDSGGIRIRGTEGRIEWLKTLRDNGKYGHLGREHGHKGGRPRNPQQGDPENPLQGGDKGFDQNPPPAPAPAPVPEETDQGPPSGAHIYAPADGPSRALARRGGPNGSPPARQRLTHPRGEELATELRELIIASKPNHALADDAAWAKTRPTWTRAMAALMRLRDPDRALEVMRWVHGDQGGRDFRFEVWSPKALADKFDRLEVAMVTPARGNGAIRDRAREILDLADHVEAGAWGKTGK